MSDAMNHQQMTESGMAGAFDLGVLKAVIFDLDGVLTDTASLHCQAWQETFNELFTKLEGSSSSCIDAFTDDDYVRLVDGRLRLDGARAVIEDRQLAYPEGTAEDGPDRETISGLAAKKDERYADLLERIGPSPYPTSIEVLRHIRSVGFRTAVITASRHCKQVLRLAGIEDLFDAVVDGNAAEAMGLPGKPSPDTLWEAAKRLGVLPGETKPSSTMPFRASSPE